MIDCLDLMCCVDGDVCVELDRVLVKWTDCLAHGTFLLYERSKGVTDASLLGLQDAGRVFDRCGLVLQDPCESEIV